MPRTVEQLSPEAEAQLSAPAPEDSAVLPSFGGRNVSVGSPPTGIDDATLERGADPSGWNDPRNSIARSYSEGRNEYEEEEIRRALAENDEGGPDTETDDEGYPVDVETGERIAEAPQAEKARVEATPKSDIDDPYIAIELDGRPVKMRQSDINALAASELARRRSEHQAPQAAPYQAPAAEIPVPTTPARPRFEPASLVSLADTIQAGTPEEAAERLAEVFNSLVAQQQSDPTEVSRTVSAELSKRDFAAEANAAVELASARYAHLVEDPDFRPVFAQRTQTEMLQSMKSVGVPDHELNMAIELGPRQVLKSFTWLRETQPRLRNVLPDMSGIVQRAGDHVERRFGVQAPARDREGNYPTNGNVVSLNDRAARKAGLAPQPRVAARNSTVQPATARPPIQSRAQLRSDVVQRMAKASGRPLFVG